jgi:hypothetical protein
MIDLKQLSQALWAPAQVNPAWATMIEAVGCKLRCIEPAVRLWHHGPAEISGCTWDLFVDEKGNGIGAVGNPWPAQVWRAWRVALSYRGPFITALSWPEQGPADDVTDPRLVQLVEAIALSADLTYLDVHEAQSLEIPWEHLQGDASSRLDWSAMPTAFNLLFYEN